MSKITKVVKWESQNGAAVELVIELTKKVEKDISYSDGWNIDLGNKINEFKEITVNINGKYHDDTRQNPVVVEGFLFRPEYIAKIKASGGYARLTDKVIINEEKYNLVMAAINEATVELEEEFAAENTEVVAKIEEAKKVEEEKKVATNKEWANKVMVEYAARETEILSEIDEEIWRKNYNNLNNEGGEGYIPSRATLEDIERAKSILA